MQKLGEWGGPELQVYQQQRRGWDSASENCPQSALRAKPQRTLQLRRGVAKELICKELPPGEGFKVALKHICLDF